MAQTPESKAKAKILKAIRETAAAWGYTVWIETNAGDAYSTPRLDIGLTLTHSSNRGWGIPVAIEVKRFDGKGKTTGRQQVTMTDMARAGVSVWLIDSDDELLRFIYWMKLGCPRQPSTGPT